MADCSSAKTILDLISELRDPKTTDVLMTGLTAFFDERWEADADVASCCIRPLRSIVESDRNSRLVSLVIPRKFSQLSGIWAISIRQPVLPEMCFKREDSRDGTESQASIRTSKFHEAGSECYNCRKSGHWKAECRKRIEDEKNEKTEESDGAACAASEINIALSAYVVSSSSPIIADSGASRHLTGNRSWFKSLRKLDFPLKVQSADGEIVAHHVGDIAVESSIDGKKWTRRTWQDVAYIPSFNASLYSTTCRESKGYGFQHAGGRMFITKDGEAGWSMLTRL